MKKLIIGVGIVCLGIMGTSCGNSDNPMKGLRKVRAYKATYTISGYTKLSASTTYIKYVDSLFNSGDVVNLSNEEYIIEY